MNLIVEIGTISISGGSDSYNYTFSESHKYVPKVALTCADNQNVFVSNLTKSTMTVNKSGAQEATIHFQAISRT
tara:strand:- start:3727 stop:3948 length:222 start_codon:yes stop_codon:yes gene_type:complete